MTVTPLFLIVNVLFFATESLTGGTVFTTPLDSHLHSQPWSGFAPRLVAHRLEKTQTTLALYAPVFDQAVALKARSLIIFMALSFALVPAVLFATGAVYGVRGAIRFLTTAALTVAVVAIVLGYRFVLLLITLYST